MLPNGKPRRCLFALQAQEPGCGTAHRGHSPAGRLRGATALPPRGRGPRRQLYVRQEVEIDCMQAKVSVEFVSKQRKMTFCQCFHCFGCCGFRQCLVYRRGPHADRSRCHRFQPAERGRHPETCAGAWAAAVHRRHHHGGVFPVLLPRCCPGEAL